MHSRRWPLVALVDTPASCAAVDEVAATVETVAGAPLNCTEIVVRAHHAFTVLELQRDVGVQPFIHCMPKGLEGLV